MEIDRRTFLAIMAAASGGIYSYLVLFTEDELEEQSSSSLYSSDSESSEDSSSSEDE
ncbi:hypothetical protein KY335_04000 [Candidatus Woesearchaeota archaeon]|nr:hypothetical protein [Candidatus Woesearchaeota archaeon]